MATPKIAPLSTAQPIVDNEGRPTPFFIRQWLEARNITVTVGDVEISLSELQETVSGLDENVQLLLAREIIAGTGLSGGGVLGDDDVTLALDAVLNTLNDVDTTTVLPTDGQALLFDGADSLWKPGDVSGGGGGSLLVPPTLSQFPTWVNQGDSAAEQSPQGPLVITKFSAGGGVDVSGRFKPLITPPAEYICMFHGFVTDTSGASFGFWLRDSGSGRLVRFNRRYDTNADDYMVSVDNYNSPTNFETSLFRQTLPIRGDTWFKLTDDGTDFIFQSSANNAAWLEFFQVARTSFLAAPDEIGFGIDTGTTRGFGWSIAVHHYEENAL